MRKSCSRFACDALDAPTRLRGRMAVETTLVLVKPDGVRRGLCGEIVARFERRGYDLRGARLLKVSKILARSAQPTSGPQPWE